MELMKNLEFYTKMNAFMKMKKMLCVCFLLTLPMMLTAQTQKGIVKTRGRMVNGQHVQGKGLPGASVTIRGGNKYNVKNNNGSFSFPVTTNTFLIQNVQKNGYQLVDADLTSKPFNVSANPIYLVMETPEQQMEDLLEAEEKISKTLREQLKKRVWNFNG